MWNTIAWIGVGSALVASLIEILKHSLYKDKAISKHMFLWGLSLSIIVTPVLYYGFTLLGEPVAMVFYSIGIYVIQKQLDMKAIRPIVKNVIQKKLDGI